MKIKKTGDAFSVANNVNREIAETYGASIKPLTSLPKSEEPAHINFKCMERVRREAEIIMYSNRQRFKTMSEVHRAAHVLGMGILYHMYAEGTAEAEKLGGDFFVQLREGDDILYQVQMIDKCLEHTMEMQKYLRRGIITDEKLTEYIYDIVVALPENLQEDAFMKCMKLAKCNEPITDLSDFRKRGRPKKKLDTE